MAYQQDPYPNQQTIECLGAQLGVSPKTIVNWFHNHRMRAKQQTSPGSGTPIKSEDDAMSNDDSMSVSSDSSYRQPPMSGGGLDCSTSQWMFPSFEPVRRGSTNSERSDPLSNSDHFDSERLRSQMLDPTSTTDFPGGDLGSPDAIAKDNNNLPLKQALTSTTKSKRKSAKPQWSYEGTHLDKSRQTNEDKVIKDFVSSSSNDVSADKEPAEGEGVPAESEGEAENGRRMQSPITTTTGEEGEEEDPVGSSMEVDSQEEDEAPVKLRRGRSSTKNKPLNCAIEKLQKAVTSSELGWDGPENTPRDIAGTADRQITQTVGGESGKGWEF